MADLHLPCYPQARAYIGLLRAMCMKKNPTEDIIVSVRRKALLFDPHRPTHEYRCASLISP
jgi:hypothetical protein